MVMGLALESLKEEMMAPLWKACHTHLLSLVVVEFVWLFCLGDSPPPDAAANRLFFTGFWCSYFCICRRMRVSNVVINRIVIVYPAGTLLLLLLLLLWKKRRIVFRACVRPLPARGVEYVYVR